MKIKTLALTALAASMTFAACDNEDNGGSQPQDLMPKSVTITLPNIQKSTRATGDAMPGGSQVELTNFKVFFRKQRQRGRHCSAVQQRRPEGLLQQRG